MEQLINVEGIVTKVLPGTMFHVETGERKHQVLAHISGKMRKRWIRLCVGDRVKMEMTPYDLGKARIVYRLSGTVPPAATATAGHARHTSRPWTAPR